MSVARVHERGDRAAFHNIQAPTLQYKTLFTEIADRKREFIWPTREADKVEVVFEYGPTRQFYKNKTGVFSLPLVQPFAAAFLPTGIEPSGQESSEMKAQAHGTKGASRNSAPGIVQVRSGRVVGISTLILRKLLLGNDLKESES